MFSPEPAPVVTPAVRESAAIYEFCDFRLDCGRFQLLHKGRPLRVERKPMELLILLVSRQGHLVPRTEIAQRLWSSEVFVDTEHGINTAIRKLRHLLRDDSDDPQFIQTVTGMGYRFVAAVSTIAPDIPAEAPPEPAAAPTAPAASHGRSKALGWYIGAAVCALLAFGFAIYRSRHRPPEVRYTQLTDFTDSAVAPALSPDGRMLAFIRGDSWFLTTDQIYVKMLPNGDARRVTDDNRLKYGLTFSPDGAEIAYTVLDPSGFSTYQVSVLGGEPQLVLKNAAGLVWLDQHQLLFSEIRTGIHLGLVTATETRTGQRDIYFPAHERGMAHYSYPSPDHHWALVVEMKGDGGWGQCRLVSLDGQQTERMVGPDGGCTSAGWSPDGSWMYFTVSVKGHSHLWRQRFPLGAPEQLTTGPTEEQGLAVEPTGAVITSVGAYESAIWIHDGSSERPLSSEGEVREGGSPPTFSPDDRILYYLLRRGEGSGAELWRTVVDSGQSEAVFPGISMIAYGLSPDGKQVVYATAAPGGSTQLWLAPVDRSSPAGKVGSPGGESPHFGPHGQIMFEQVEGNRNYLEQMNPDGSNRTRVVPYPIVEFRGISPSGRWAMVVVPRTPERNLPAAMAIPLDGGPARQLCTGYCSTRWSTDGRFLFVQVEASSRTDAGRSLAIPVGPGESLPEFPAGGIAQLAEPSVVPGSQSVARWDLTPGKDPEHYAWINYTVHRNLYRISLP